MLKKIASFLIVTVALYLGAPAFAQDYDDLANSGAVAQSSQAAELLNQIEQILEELQREMGGNFSVQVEKNSSEDVRWSARFDSVNVELGSLWSQFFAAVNQEVEQRQYERDQAFRTAMATAFQTYRSIFTGAGDGPSVQYNAFVARAGAKNLTLRRDVKFWIDKKVNFNSGLGSVNTGSASPATWDNGELDYAMGLMPAEMLNDVNKSISAAYFYGYVNEWYENDPSTASSKFLFLGVGSYNLSFDTTFSEATYYDSIYRNSQYLPTLSNQFRASTPKAATGSSDVASMGEQVSRIEDLLSQAEGFATTVNEREGSTVVTSDKGNMYLHRSIDKATAERILGEYEQLQTQFKQAMDTFKVYLNSYRQNFGGAESLALQQAMRDAFNAYGRDFVYSEIDAYGTRYDALKTRANQFKLDRRGFAAFDKDLSTPGWGQRPRRELYSAQRLLTLLPGTMTARIDEKRRQAFNWGRYNAEAEYREALNYSYGNEWGASSYTYATEPADSPGGSTQLPGDDLGGSGSGYDTEPGAGDTEYPDYGTDDGDTDYDTYGGSDDGDSTYPDYGTDNGNGEYPDYGTDNGDTDYDTYGSSTGSDLDSASLSSLTAIPGIGEATASKILAGGPYYGWDDLLAVNGIGEATAQKLSDAGFRIGGQPFRP